MRRRLGDSSSSRAYVKKPPTLCVPLLKNALVTNCLESRPEVRGNTLTMNL